MTSGEECTFSDLLRRYRLAAGLTQEELSERAGVSARAVSNLERGVNRRPRRDTLDLLAVALELSGPDQQRFRVAGRRRTIAASPIDIDVGDDEEIGASLPFVLSSFIGRERELAEIGQLLIRADVRLLTLVGEGGIGKTRLGLRALDAMKRAFADGVRFISLESITKPAFVIPTIAEALGISMAPERLALGVLSEHLRGRQQLLMLDNFEQVAGAASDLANLLHTCSGLTLLVTSRAVLRVEGEHVYAVPPLEVPPANSVITASEALGYAAVELLSRRAVAGRNDFSLSDGEAWTAAEVCRRLDGLPLAIELAAARLRLLPLNVLLARLSDSLSLLTDGTIDAPARQRTLRATIDWSYHLLNTFEQQVLARLSVFSGGFSLEAAEAVASLPADGESMLNGLSALVDQSFLRLTRGYARPRYRTLTTINDYGAEQLRRTADSERFRRRHARYFLRLAESMAPSLMTGQQEASLDRLEADYDNLRVAMQWFISRGDTARALRMGGALWWFWYVHGHQSEGRRGLVEALALPRSEDDQRYRAKALNGAGYLSWCQGDFAASELLFKHALELARALGDPENISGALNGLGRVACYSRRDYAAARAMSTEALVIQRGLGNRWGIAQSTYFVGVALAFEGDYEHALRSLFEASRLFRQVGDWSGLADTLGVTAMIALDQDRLADARSLIDEAQAIVRGRHDLHSLAKTWSVLGDIQLNQDQPTAARAAYAEGLRLERDLRDRWWIVWCLEGMAGVASAFGDFERAARLLGGSAALRTSSRAPQPRIHRSSYERHASQPRLRLDPETFAIAWEAGQTLTLDEAIDLALTDDGTMPRHS